MPLTVKEIASAKPRTKPFRLYDSGGLYLEVSPTGGKWWRLKYRLGGKEKRLSLGVYPKVGLAKARERREEERKLLSKNVDPGVHRRIEKSTQAAAQAGREINSFEQVAREWFVKFSPNWAQAHAARKIRLFERDVFPPIGKRPIAEITAPELLSVLRKIEERKALVTERRALVYCGQVFRYAVAAGYSMSDPSSALADALPSVKGEHFSAVTDPISLAPILQMLDGYLGTLPVRCALRLMPLVFVRPGELRKAEWAQFDLDGAEWRYLVTKTDSEHIVPLSRQALAILRELYPLTGRGRFVFPGARSTKRPMSDNAILAAMRIMGISKDVTTGHGFRATARTILDEVLGVRPDLIEHQLVHAVKDSNGRAYNRTAFLPERREMMQTWADYLDRLKANAAPASPFRSVA
jgi:integrase